MRVASKRIATDGVNLFAEVAEDFYVDQHNQVPFNEVIARHLQYIRWNRKGQPMQLRLSQYPDSAKVIIDPRFGWGRPVMAESKTPVSAVVDLWHAGEPMDVVAEEFDLSRDVVEDICRVAA